MPKSISVIVVGATGDAGSGVLQACIDHPSVKKITVVTRRTTGVKDKKLKEVILDDFLNWHKIEDNLEVHDACYWCLGVSQSDVSGEEEYTRITYDFTMAAAGVLEKLNPGMTFCFLSGLGTDPSEKSRMMWARVKGRAEADLRKFDFKVYVFRPAFIHPVKGRKSHYLSMRILYPFIKHSRRSVIEAEIFGRAMINATLYGYKKNVLKNVDMWELAEKA
jgi:uncharacterized protein YbjT (DUF2867 family)